MAGDAALLFNASDANAIAHALRHLLSDPHRRTDLRQRGLCRAAAFFWQRTARETLQVYRSTLR